MTQLKSLKLAKFSPNSDRCIRWSGLAHFMEPMRQNKFLLLFNYNVFEKLN